MRKNLYATLAARNLRSAKSTYLPYLLTGSVSTALFYALLSLAVDKSVPNMQGGMYVQMVLILGCIIMTIFCAQLLFYTNSFLIKRRTKELGLYCVLGMEKRHVGRVLLFETLYTAAGAIALGLLGGVFFSRLMLFALTRLLGEKSVLAAALSVPALAGTAGLFAVLYGMTYLYNRRKLRKAKPVELLAGGNQGEKEPRTAPILALLGVLLLGGGYVLALMDWTSAEALLIFFPAVLCVIFGTLCLFTAGSVAVLKALRRNHAFYYKPRNFVAVSGLIYRMKQNAAGLTAICVLSTMVLVTVSATVCLYAGREESLASIYPTDFSASNRRSTAEEEAAFESELAKALAANGVKETARYVFHSAGAYASQAQGSFTARTADDWCSLVFVPQADYNAMTDAQPVQLAADEVFVAAVTQPYPYDTLSVNGTALRVVGTADSFGPFRGAHAGLNLYYAVVADTETALRLACSLGGYTDANAPDWNAYLNLDGTPAQHLAIETALRPLCPKTLAMVSSRASLRAEWNAMYGSFLFLGIFLGALFLLATALIIYYKQLSEGCDDRARFDILQKVGMNEDEVQAVIGRQVLLVFFLPVAFAALHLAFAWKLLCILLSIFSMTNLGLFAVCTLTTFAAFALIYFFVYRRTAHTYTHMARGVC